MGTAENILKEHYGSEIAREIMKLLHSNKFAVIEVDLLSDLARCKNLHKAFYDVYGHLLKGGE